MESDKMITVGVLTPHTTPGPEVELPDMAPGRIRVEVSHTPNGVSASPGDAGASSEQALRALAAPASLDVAASALMPAADVLAFASTGSGYALGYHEESTLVERLQARWGVPACATALSMVAALRARHIESVSLVHPPWFGRALNDRGAEYFQSQGFKVVDARLADLPDDPNRVEPAMVVEWIVKHFRSSAEAVVLGGNGFRAAHAVHQLERRTGRLVLEANQVLLWSVLKRIPVSLNVRGFGMLFDARKSAHNTPEEDTS